VTDATEGRPTTTDHKDLGRSLNGLVWRLLARNDRTAEDDARMVDAAHASQYHGREAGGPPGTRGRVADFDHAYAAEAMARALACAGDLDQAASWHARATAVGARIADDRTARSSLATWPPGPGSG
jgi:hypothetical protein